MKSRAFFLSSFFFLVMGSIASAQTSQADFTDEDLRNYAIVMDSVDAMKANLQAIVTDMVQNNEVMSVSRYNDLYKIMEDSTKLTEAKATEAEVEFLKQVKARQQEEVDKINNTYQTMARDFVGAKEFNAIHRSLRENEEVKAKYEAISKELDSKRGE